jgi:hypothetical protein
VTGTSLSPSSFEEQPDSNNKIKNGTHTLGLSRIKQEISQRCLIVCILILKSKTCR